MKTFLFNAAVRTQVRTRRATYNGKEYLVAPLSLIVPGVLSGSKGGLMYHPGDISASTKLWDNTPIVVYHPTNPLNGAHLSAKDPGVLERSGIGHLRNTKFNGKLVSEGWFDPERTRIVDQRVYDALMRGEPMELSTGLYTENRPAAAGSVDSKGRAYEYTAHNYIPDHLAVLPDQVGACSLRDGCGVLVNQANHNAWVPLRNAEEALRDTQGKFSGEPKRKKPLKGVLAGSAEAASAMQNQPERLKDAGRVANSKPNCPT